MAKSKAAAKVVEPEPTPSVDASGYTVVARRYRPQQFADLIGQEHIAQALTNSITSGRIAHAFLFTGARGVGKTSSARILAKALNCVNGPTAKPCDVCEICKSIVSGEDGDVLEIDGASNNKVEEIRDLKSNVGFRPQRARFKIYIIDEVHMLSNSAFNALLKTLEEPPAHVKFIFATTEVQKIPITILSRCQRFDFSAIGPTKVFETLKHIVKKEGLEAEDDALHIVSRRAAGSMRDAQTLLDQLLGYCEGKLTAAKLNELLGTAGDDRMGQLAEAIVQKDAKSALDLVHAAAEAGLQLGEMLDQLIDYWRGLMLVQIAGPNASDLPGLPSQHDRLRNHAKLTSLDTILAGLDILTTTKSKARSSPSVQVLLEMAVVRLSRLEELLSVASLLQLAQSGAPVGKIGQSPTPRSAVAAPLDPSKKNDRVTVEPVVTSPAASTYGEINERTLPGIWERTLADVGMIRGKQLEAAGLPAILGPNSLAIRFSSGYSSQYDAIRQEASLETIRRTLKLVTQQDVQLRVELTAEVREVMPPPMVAIDRKKDLMKLPIFQKAMSTLGAQLLKVDDGFNPYLDQPVAVAVVTSDDDEEDNPVVTDPDEV
jgi:DNA polymerase III subunit gamma/tau